MGKKNQNGSKKIVIALGGNAILQKDQIGTYEEQQENIKKTAKSIASVVLGKHRYKVSVITHGNGPQVGNLLLQQEFAKNMPNADAHGYSYDARPNWIYAATGTPKRVFKIKKK